jgi:hypothetical protein
MKSNIPVDPSKFQQSHNKVYFFIEKLEETLFKIA